MTSTSSTPRPFNNATFEVLIGNLKAAVDFNASPALIAQLVNEIELRKEGK